MAYREHKHEPRGAHNDRGSGPDFTITYHGTVSTLDLFTDAARQWVDDNLDIEPWQWLSAAGAAGKCRVAIDPRSMDAVRNALAEAGFTEG